MKLTPELPDDSVVPRWARIADWAVVGLLVLAACVFIFGGFREYVAHVRISVRSSSRLLALAAVIAGLRHWVIRQPTIAATLRNAALILNSSAAWRAAWAPFLSTRVMVLLVGFLAVVTVGPEGMTNRTELAKEALTTLPARWDAIWYMTIAQDGYQWDGDPSHQQNVVFFPAFPIAMRAVGVFFAENWLYAGVVVALASFLLALMYLYRLARQSLDNEHAETALWAIAAYPFAVYFSAPYTESLYLLASVATFFYLTKRQWWHAAGWGVLVGLCRPNGCFIALPAAMFALNYVRSERRLPLPAVVAVVAPVAGLLAYCAFLYWQFGDAFVWMKGQLAWGRVFTGLGSSVRTLVMDRVGVGFIAEHGLYRHISVNTYDFLYTLTAIFALLAVWPCTKRFGVAYALFILINLGPPLITGGMMSIGRMTSVLFPCFLWFAAIVPPAHRTAWVAAGCTLQGLIAVLFFTWRPAF
jgi:hypothetical protein